MALQYILKGTTRDSFQGKTVTQLEYEAYDTMAEKEMKKICDNIHQKWGIEKVIMVHRIGYIFVVAHNL